LRSKAIQRTLTLIASREGTLNALCPLHNPPIKLLKITPRTCPCSLHANYLHRISSFFQLYLYKISLQPLICFRALVAKQSPLCSSYISTC
jgi:hypothetical protein